MKKTTLLASAAMLLASFSFTIKAQTQNFTLKFSQSSRYQGLVPEEVLWERGNLFWTYTYEGDNDDLRFHKLFLYDSGLNLIKTISDPGEILPCNYMDSYRSDYRIPVTQDVFKDDSKFEYITATRLDDEDSHITEIAIKQEDGTVLATIPFTDGYALDFYYYGDWDGIPIDIIKLDGEHWYLCVHLCGNDTQTIRLYSFKQGNVSSIKKIKDIPSKVKVNPALPQKNEAVKVDLSAVQSPSSLSVVSADGKVVYNKALRGDEKEVSVETSGLSAGMYIVRVSDGNTTSDNCKIIIR